jgi:hypothetical protein
MATPTSRPPYDRDAWAAATDLGRRVFNYNYRMTGSEIRGWELVNTVEPPTDEPGLTERIYLWEKKGSAGRQLIRIAITETGAWRRAQGQLQAQLVQSMRPDIARGAGKLARLGDVSYAAGLPDAGLVAAIQFVRGNLSISVASVGDEPVDVAAVAKSLDLAFSALPNAKDLQEARALDRSAEPLTVAKDAPTLLKDALPAPVLRNGWLKVIVPDGEIAREGDALVYRPDSDGAKRIRQFVVVQEQNP